MYFGIDLGTTNSLITYWIKIGDTFDVKPIKNTFGQTLTPSVVSFEEETNKPVIGKTALDNYEFYSERTVRWVKRDMGKDITYNLGGHSYNPQIISAYILKELKTRAEKDLQIGPDEDIKEVVITVPADFDVNAKRATIDAAKIAGFNEVHLIAEPNAAILNYIFRTQEGGKLEEKFNNQNYYVVFDLGGGTFDVSLSSIYLDNMGMPNTSVISSSGDKYLGGINFDFDLMVYILEKAKILYANQTEYLDILLDNCKNYLENRSDLQEDIRDTLARIIKECENGKIGLTDDSKKFFTFMIHTGKTFRIEISREEFNEILQPYFNKIKKHIKNVLNDAKISTNGTLNSWDCLNGILLVGGSTNIPAVRDLCKEIFGKDPIDGIDTFESVGKGAAIYSAIKQSPHSIFGQFSTIVPHDFGIMYQGEFKPILKKGSELQKNNYEFIVPFSLDVKSPIKIAQKYHNESEKEILLDIERIDYSHPFLYTGDILDVSLTMDDNSILSVRVKERCVEDYLELITDYSAKLTEFEIKNNQEVLFGVENT